MTLLVFPALDEVEHVPRLAAFASAVTAAGIVDRVVLLDGGSSDGTVQACAAYGLESLRATDLPDPRPAELPGVKGKGGAVRRLLAAVQVDRLVLIDADVTGLTPDAVAALLAPLDDPSIVLVKGVCTRIDEAGVHHPEGRVSALVARPALDLMRSELAGLKDPLSGQVAFRPSAIDAAALPDGYGLEIGMLLAVAHRTGVASIREVDLGPITHRHKDVESLAPVARDVLAVLLARSRRPDGVAPSCQPPVPEARR